MEGIDYKKLYEEQSLYVLELEQLVKSLESQVSDKRKKVNKNKPGNIPPLAEFVLFCEKLLPTRFKRLEFSLIAKYNQWVYDGWVDGNRKPIINWKLKITNTIPYLKEFDNNGRQGDKSKSEHYREKVSTELDEIFGARRGEGSVGRDEKRDDSYTEFTHA